MSFFKCLTSEQTNDNFVGIRFDKDGIPEIVFPHGYAIPKKEEEQRKDVFALINVLSWFGKQQNGNRIEHTAKKLSSLPIQSYQYIINDYFAHGYYTEKETIYTEASKGKISWKRTIQKEKPQLSGNNPVYLQFQVKNVKNNADNLLSKIHRYCVYESFQRFGWLYLSNEYLPLKPDVPYNKPLFLSVLRTELSHTFNDNKKQLLNSMIHIVNFEKEDTNYREDSLGVNHFSSVWEQLIDHVFGEDNIETYFPHANWLIMKNNQLVKSTALEPDTIMKIDDKYYVLDAKYYRYGITEETGDLPNTSSIQKQITYGKHIADKGFATQDKVYSAFVMPYDCGGVAQKLNFVATGTAGWEENNQKLPENANYQYILGILLDTRHLITTFTRKNATEIIELARLIEKSLTDYKNLVNAQPSSNQQHS